MNDINSFSNEKMYINLEILIMDGNSVCDKKGFDKYAIDNLKKLKVLNWVKVTHEMKNIGW